MLAWLIDKTVVVALMALLVTLVCRFGRLRPAARHALWLIVLVKLLCPPVVWWPWSAAEVFLPPRGGHVSALVRPPPLPMRTDPIPVQSATDMRQAAVIPSPASRPANTAKAQVPRSHAKRLQPRGESQPPSRPPARLEPSGWLDRGRLVALFGWLWGLGAAAVFVHQVRRIVRCSRLARSARPGPAWLVEHAGQIAAVLKLRPPRVLVADGVRTPFIWCLGRPALVWPADLADESNPARWRPVITHELAHLKRLDHWVAWLQLAGECLWWWNPLFWHVRRRLRETAELACDAWAVSIAPDSRRTFAEALLVISRRTPSGRLSLPALGVASGGRRSFERRLTMIFSDHTACSLSRRALFSAWLLAMLAVPCWSLGQEKPGEDSPEAVNVTAKAGPQRTIRIHENRVYIADGNEKTITALDGSSGKIVWQTKTDGWNGEADLVFEGDQLYLGSTDGLVVYRKLLKLDKNTGKYLAADASPEEPPHDQKADPAGPLKRRPLAVDFEFDAKKPGKVEVNLEAGGEIQLHPKQAPEGVDKIQLADQSGRGSSTGFSGLVELASAYIDALGERDLAERKLEIQTQLAATKAISSSELVETKQCLVTAERKARLFRKIAEAAKSAAEVDVHELKTMYESGRISRSQLSEAEIRLTVLMAILDS